MTVAYTTQSSDSRGLGDIAIVGVLAIAGVGDPGDATGEHLRRLAVSMYSNPPSRQTQARWILTQCIRARIAWVPSHRDLPGPRWTADLNHEVRLDALFANHALLRTERLAIG